ncbi:BrnT family toxin [Patescibacteria group bacterium]|nr:BrnT family toxin [Patescibacteria group bacterium]MCG2701688.1 BrnT family toxin [Candidatus Parcubacteria bacterium]MBU4210078.1 BrnT family toxin [Patescibacteria group bacterium]MBU4265377.1 BrnT family toxin [Patescibacteria group bacterium]MBU4390329.1 BrnT family toxin [Patescibacteria group bacterium]
MFLPDPIEFQWDKGNKDKNLLKHDVSLEEIEQSFFDSHKKQFEDKLHSKNENRYILIGKTRKNRILFIIYTIRKNKIRVISARDLNKRRYYLYEKTT